MSGHGVQPINRRSAKYILTKPIQQHKMRLLIPSDLNEDGTSASDPNWYLNLSKGARIQILNNINAAIGKGGLLDESKKLISKYEKILEKGMGENASSSIFGFDPYGFIEKQTKLNEDSRANLRRIKSKLIKSLIP